MADNVTPPGPQAPQLSPSALRIINSILGLVILLLLVFVAWQAIRIGGLQADLEQSRRTLDQGVSKLALEKLQGRRVEMVEAAKWLEQFYRSPEGLQRPDGLWRADVRETDVEAIGVWILDVYLNERVSGKTDAEARQKVVDAIRATDEWRKKHPNQ